mgnify:CR=1 FL=1
MEYISQDYNGLTKAIAELIAGIEVPVNTNGFANDLTTFRGKDDVLTLLIHLGYLAYDSKKKTLISRTRKYDRNSRSPFVRCITMQP